MLADPGRRILSVRSAARRLTTDRRRMATLLVVMVPVIVVLVMGWQRRWTSDDGFINFRYVDQIRSGNGPVFNAGERVEAFTSPLWLGVLLFLDVVLPLRLEWIAVVAGLVLTAAGFVFAAAGTARLWRHAVGEGPMVPAGLLLFAAVPPVWDFATSGLDNALGVAWLGASWWALCRRVFPQGTRHEGKPTPWSTCVLVGLGPLVRPELGIVTTAFLIVVLISERSWGARGRTVLWALALPLAYEAFRMAYYAAVVSNTALAKEAGASEWTRGWGYLLDTLRPYRLWIPLLLLVALGLVPLVRSIRARGSRLEAILVAAPIAAGITQAAYVVRVGGDFMHARMLLLPLFCVVLPVAVVVIRGWRWVPAVLLVPWLLISAIALRPSYDGVPGTGITDERAFYVKGSAEPNPVTIDDYLHGSLDSARAGRDARVIEVRGERGLVLGLNPSAPLPLEDHVVQTSVVSVVFTVGLYGYAAGPDVFVVDSLGLSTALGSRFRAPSPPPDYPPNGWAGHDKRHRDAWDVARFASPAPDEPRELRDARRSLRCGSVPVLLEAVTGRFGPGRAWRNVWESFTLTTFRLSESPEQAVRELCG
jgi:arabinofuranosyltransferase